uniref:Transmembrane domain-containing protein n=1 Tax=Caenorhabditis tropicalis TaxID=1561998 RepID=A0A1I7TWG2_9PELO
MASVKGGITVFSQFVWIVMAFSAVSSLFVIGSFPFVKGAMLQYEVPEPTCTDGQCNPVCIINGTALGSEFGNVQNYYTLPICSFALIANFFLVMLIFESRCINVCFTTFAFFCLIVFPIRFTFLAMQTLEFTTVGGDYYTLILLNHQQYDCPLFSGFLDAVFFMNLRFLLLVIDFFTFHTLIVSVPLFYVDDKIQSKKYSAVHDEKMITNAQPTASLIFQEI